MESGHHHFLLKLSRLFPSSFMASCQLQTLPDVAETLTKPDEILHENDLSPFLKTPPNNICKQTLFWADQKPHQECKKSAPLNQMMSSSSNYSGWFSSSDGEDGAAGTDAFFSMSSNSAESFPLMKTAFGRMKTIDELGRLSLSSACSFDAVVSQCSRRKSSLSRELGKKCSEYELGSDHIPAEVYYGEFVTRARRKPAKGRRKTRRKRRSWVVEGSYAVEKRSSDPYGDFRASMVEMIVEKQMLGAEELERLLICFLSLNEVCYHGMIVDVFSEICQTLFSNS
ncbi:Transcription repressor OFP8 [Sesamum alatum]|uniref:Transcription repressor n=1 Tax=Sesamum alatum TaxID=300844 RepID=A0AAE2CHC8_9LAMI|nr:Transcription repressor OFP8 [Sesamum alatum]